MTCQPIIYVNEILGDTASFISIDRSEYDAAPALFLPFDGVGARHPGMTHDAGALGVGAGIPPGILFRTAYRNKTCCKGPRDKR